MIRYIWIGDQIIEGDNAFCFYNTIIDKFIELDGESVFDNKDDFLMCLSNSKFLPDDRQRIMNAFDSGQLNQLVISRR